MISQIENPQLGLICPTIDKSGHSLCLQAAGLTPLLVPFSATGDTIKCSFTTKYGRSCEAIDQGEDAAKWLSDFIGKPCRLCCTTNSVQTPILDAVKVDTVSFPLFPPNSSFSSSFSFSSSKFEFCNYTRISMPPFLFQMLYHLFNVLFCLCFACVGGKELEVMDYFHSGKCPLYCFICSSCSDN